jgi:hypothetical protein
MAASGSWPFQVNLLQGDGAPVASVIPQEGATGWADTTMMHVDAPHPNCAYMWMEHTLSSNLMSDLSVWFGANPGVPAACTDGRGMQTAEGCTKNGFDDFERSGSGPRPCRLPAGRMRALLPLGVRLHRRDRRPLRPSLPLTLNPAAAAAGPAPVFPA